MGRMHRIDEHHRFIGVQAVEQLFILIDKGLLARFVEMARDTARLALFKFQPMHSAIKPAWL